MPEPKLIFYDLSSIKKPEFWSPNTGKVRAMMNYLQVEYELNLLRYPEIAPTLQKKGCKAWPSGMAKHRFTVPALTFINSETGEEEKTVMGGDMKIVDALVAECHDKHGNDLHERVFRGQEKFIREKGVKYREYLSVLLYPTCGPFVLNLLDDEETKEFYHRTRIEDGRGDMLEAQKKPIPEFHKAAENFSNDLLIFKSLEVDDEFKSQFLDKFLNGEQEYILCNDGPSYFDFQLATLVKWYLQCVEVGAPYYDVFAGNPIWTAWYEKVSKFF